MAESFGYAALSTGARLAPFKFDRSSRTIGWVAGFDTGLGWNLE